MLSLQMPGAAWHVLDGGRIVPSSEVENTSASLNGSSRFAAGVPQTPKERAKIAALLEQAGRKDLAIHYMGCRSWNPDNPYRCGLRWICPPCGWIAQQRAKDEMNARSRTLQILHPNDLFVMTTTNAPRGRDLRHEIEMLGVTRTWIRRSRARSEESAWSACLGSYFFTDFAPRKRWPHDVFAHDHAIHVFQASAVFRWAEHDADRREAMGKCGYRQLVWPRLHHGLRRDMAAAFTEFFPKEFKQEQAKKKHPERFFFARMADANAEAGCETFVPGWRTQLLKDLREITEYSWATDPKDEKFDMTAAQRVQIQCLTGLRMRGGSGVFYGIPGVASLAKSILRGRMIGQRMADQMKDDNDWDELTGNAGSQKGVLSCAWED